MSFGDIWWTLEKFGELWRTLVKFVSFLKILQFSEIVSVFLFFFFQRVSKQRSYSLPLRGWSLLNVVLLVYNITWYLRRGKSLPDLEFFPCYYHHLNPYINTQYIKSLRGTYPVSVEMSVPPSFRPSPFAWTTVLVGSDEGDPEKALVGVGTTHTWTATIPVSLGHSTV